MNTNATPAHRPVPSQTTFWEKFGAAAMGGLSLALAFTILFSIVLTILFAGKVLPGVSVAGVDLGGLNQTEAEAQLRERISYPETGLIALEYNGQLWTFTPAELGLAIDYPASIQQAYNLGRSGWPWHQLKERLAIMQAGRRVPAVLILDEYITRQTLSLVANEVNQEMREANLRLEGLQVRSEPGQVGRYLDVEAVIGQIQEPMLNLF
ncbi:MAG: peptidoglycan binding domain-containing protein, partial [Anaerolineales bacterium]